VFCFRINRIEPVQKSVLTDERDVVSKNVEFKEVKMVFLDNSVFKTEVTKFFFYFVNPVKRIFYVF
jgi:hypothetical protein